MRNDQVETLTQLSNDALKVRMKAEACIAANSIIRTYFGTDNRVANMQGFYTALLEALKKARELGHEGCSEEDVLLLTDSVP
jgi:hypothetical protein